MESKCKLGPPITAAVASAKQAAGYFIIGEEVHVHIIEKPTNAQLIKLQQAFGFICHDE